MAVGFRMFTDFQRPEPELVAEFKGIPSSNIGDCVRKMTCMFGGIRPFNKHNLLGTAFTSIATVGGDAATIAGALNGLLPEDAAVAVGGGYKNLSMLTVALIGFALAYIYYQQHQNAPVAAVSAGAEGDDDDEL